MSKNSALQRYTQLKEWWFIFNRKRKYKPRKKTRIIPTDDEDN